MQLTLSLAVVFFIASFITDCSAQTGVKRDASVPRRGQNVNGTEKWAYVDVRPQAHMFYWLYHSYHPDGYLNRPWILWLEGGPGASGTGYGNFEIIGPLDLELKERNTTWVNQASVLFVDNPVGAGYSYVDHLSALTTTTEQISNDLVEVLKAVLAESPEFEEIPFYIFGQSYGGKMAAHVARQLYDEILMGNIKMKLMGFAMGNSWISPVDSTLTWGPLLYWMSVVDEQGLSKIQRSAKLCANAVKEERWRDATRLWEDTEYVVDLWSNSVSFYNILKYTTSSVDSTKFSSDFGFLYRQLFPEEFKLMADPLNYLMNGPIRKKLEVIPDHVIWEVQSGDVFDAQKGDFMKPVVHTVDSALNETTLQAVVYQGQLDLICDTKGTMDWVDQLRWPSMPNYHSAVRKPLVDPRDDQTYMFVKAYKQFKFYWVLGAGHAVPKDNADAAYRMLERILANTDV